MCGIALTLAYHTNGRNAQAETGSSGGEGSDGAAAPSSSAVSLVARSWSQLAQQCLRPRGPDAQQSLELKLEHGDAGSAAISAAAVLTGAVLHLRVSLSRQRSAAQCSAAHWVLVALDE
jgi:hypothetical protein